jgi:uncharacterized peroxidase-related enzyme
MNAVPPKPAVSVEAEPFIPYLPEDQFAPQLRKITEPYKKRMGFLPNALKLHAYRPEIAEIVWTLNNKVMRDPSSALPQFLKRKLAAVICATNGCAYCTAHSCSMLKRPNSGDPMTNEGWGVTEAELQGLIDGTTAIANPMEKACFDYARAASADPTAVPREILDALKKHLTPPQIMELAFVVCFWKFYNTLHDSLHIPVERVLLGDTGYVDLVP